MRLLILFSLLLFGCFSKKQSTNNSKNVEIESLENHNNHKENYKFIRKFEQKKIPDNYTKVLNFRKNENINYSKLLKYLDWYSIDLNDSTSFSLPIIKSEDYPLNEMLIVFDAIHFIEIEDDILNLVIENNDFNRKQYSFVQIDFDKKIAEEVIIGQKINYLGFVKVNNALILKIHVSYKDENVKYSFHQIIKSDRKLREVEVYYLYD